MPSITCTNCGAVLKTKDPIPPGKKVKCPKCTQAFVVPEEEKPAAAASEEREGVGADDFQFDKPANSDAGNEEATEEGGEDKGAAKKGGKGDGKKKSNTMLIAIIVGVVLLCCCCPTTCGGIWQAFGVAIQTALGIGDAALKKKMDDDLKKAIQDGFKDQNKGKK